MLMKSRIMYTINVFIIILVVNASILTGGVTADELPNDRQVAKGRVESCSGCSLNRLPDVKAFIFDDIPYFHNVEFKSIRGRTPELILLNKNDEEIERIPLSDFTREQCNELLIKKGFFKKTALDQEVPEQFKTGPYIPRTDL